MPALLHQSTPVARKEHTCMWCGGIIHTGERYERQTNIFDGDIYDWTNHLDCLEAANRLDMFDECDDNGLGPDDFREHLQDYIDWMYTEADASIIWNKDDVHSSVRKILDDWDTPYVKRRRLEREIYRLNDRIKLHGKFLSPERLKTLNEKRSRLQAEHDTIPMTAKEVVKMYEDFRQRSGTEPLYADVTILKDGTTSNVTFKLEDGITEGTDDNIFFFTHHNLSSLLGERNAKGWTLISVDKLKTQPQ